MSNRWPVVLCAAALSLGAAHPLLARDGNANQMEIFIKGFGCNSVPEVWVVMDGDELGQILAEHIVEPDSDRRQSCHWRVRLAPDESFHTKHIRFSLRLSGLVRTGCRKAEWVQDQLAYIRFEFEGGGVRQLTLKPDPETPLVYVREVRKKDEQCDEDGKLRTNPKVPWDIRDVDTTLEDVRVRRIEGDRDLCGLLVTKLPALNKAASKKGVPIELKKPALLFALRRQKDGQNGCQRGSLASSAADISQKQLDERPLKSLSITVQ
jgi:hypothetical protein